MVEHTQKKNKSLQEEADRLAAEAARVQVASPEKLKLRDDLRRQLDRLQRQAQERRSAGTTGTDLPLRV